MPRRLVHVGNGCKKHRGKNHHHRTGRYTPRFSMDRIAKVEDVDNYFNKRMRYRIRQAAETLQA